MECPVCFEVKPERNSLFLCDHTVCTDCTYSWSATQRNQCSQETCPVCRAPSIDDYQTCIGGESSTVLVFTRDGHVLLADDVINGRVETGVYETLRNHFDEGEELMVTRLSFARNWEAYRLDFRLSPDIDKLARLLDLPVTCDPNYQRTAREYRALKRYLRDCDSVVLSRMFVNEEETDDDVVEIIPLADFIGIRMVIHRLTSNQS